jgi:hypothetical protein
MKFCENRSTGSKSKRETQRLICTEAWRSHKPSQERKVGEELNARMISDGVSLLRKQYEIINFLRSSTLSG